MLPPDPLSSSNLTLRAWLRSYGPLLGVIALVLLLALPTLTYPLGRDQGEFATIGRGLLQGKIPYADLWNPKPPAIFYLYAGAMAVFGQTALALRLLDLLAAPVLLWAIYWIGARAGGKRVGLWAALLLGVFYFTETFWTLSQNDGLVLVPMMLGLVAALKAADGGARSWGWALVSGALAGIAVWFKYPFVLFAGVAALAYVLMSRQIRVLDVAAFACGLLGALAAGASVMLAIGAWDALLESARVTSAYTALGFNLADFAAAMENALGFRWSQWGLAFVLAAGGMVAGLWPRTSPETRQRRMTWVLIGWLAVGFAIMALQAKGYDYHWLPMLPPLALLAALGAAALTRRLPGWAQIAAGAVVFVLAFAAIWRPALPYLSGQQDQIAYFDQFQGGEVNAGESQRVVDYLRARTTPGDSLYVWGFRPEVYYLSGLNPATRFIFQFPLVADWYPPEWRQQNVDTLWAALPPYVAVLQADYMPWVTGSHDDSNTLLQQYEELNDWLIYNYALDTQIGNFFLWRRTN
ncbi:MAG TPA: glycosyltransferase family 39 protein [Candidatus Limnocylindrales bacterium]|nr:glycosyltransferase family 39 protein [Candidatus Limnocylindrales bacterium]